MVSFDGRETNEKIEKVEAAFDEAVKASGYKMLHEGFSEGAEDLLEEYSKLRAESQANAHKNVLR